MGLTAGDTAYAVVMSIVLGMTLGAVWDLSAPLYRRLPLLTDLLLCIWLVWIWMKIAFDICAGDLRTGYYAAAAFGAFAWRRWISPVTMPKIVKFRITIGKGFRRIVKPAKYIWKKIKFFEKNSFQREKNGVQ